MKQEAPNALDYAGPRTPHVSDELLTLGYVLGLILIPAAPYVFDLVLHAWGPTGHGRLIGSVACAVVAVGACVILIKCFRGWAPGGRVRTGMLIVAALAWIALGIEYFLRLSRWKI